MPAPVPPLIRQFSRPFTHAAMKLSIGAVSAFRLTRSSACRRSAGKRRIDSSGPSTASGGMMALTREPSRQARVHHRRAVVDAAADAADDAVDDAQQVLVVLERRGDAFEHALSLDEDLLVGVDQDVVDRRIAEQRLERPEAEHIVQDLGEQRFAFAQVDRGRLLGQQLTEKSANLTFGARAIRLRQRFQVQPVEQLAVDVATQLQVLRTRALRSRPQERSSVSE